MKKIILLAIIFVIDINLINAQTPKTENTPQQQPPIELNRLIIEGIERVNVKAGSKQLPIPQTRLSPQELDSLNPLEKQPSLLIPPPQLPSALSFPIIPNGYLEGDFGLFSTYDLKAGYRHNFKGYELYGKFGVEGSGGEYKNSDYTKLNINLNSDYIAPDYFWIFGGSRTLTRLNGNYHDFKLYGMDSAIARRSFDLQLNLESKGNFEGVIFATGGEIATLQINQKDANFFENRLNGYLKAYTHYNNYAFGGKIDLNLGNWNGDQLSIHQLIGTGSMYFERITLEGEFGYQLAVNSRNNIQSMPTLKLGMSYLPNLDFTVKAEFYTGLEKSFAREYFLQNPYFELNTDIIYPRANAIMKGLITYAPDVKKSITISGSLNFYEHYPIFNSITEGVQNNSIYLLFETANIIKLSTEGYWEITNNSALNGLFGVNIAIMDYQSNIVPYIPKIYGMLNYRITLFDILKPEIGIFYNSPRYADKNNKIELNSYFNLYAKARLQLLENLSVKLEMNNLTGNNNFVWKGYKEFGLFGKIGILWQF